MNVTREELDALLARRGKPQGQPAPESRRNKYGAKRTEYDGRTYDSKAEAEYAMRLDLRVKAGEILFWKPQQTVYVEVGPGSWMYWRPAEALQHEGARLLLRCRLDFLVWTVDHEPEYHEVKGYRVRDWVLRRRILKLAGVPLVVSGRDS